MHRTIYAKITADEDGIIAKQEVAGIADMGDIDYFVHKFSSWIPSCFELDEAMIADDDSTEPWDRYIAYVLEYALSHGDPCYGCYCDGPVSYQRWKERNGVK